MNSLAPLPDSPPSTSFDAEPAPSSPAFSRILRSHRPAVLFVAAVALSLAGCKSTPPVNDSSLSSSVQSSISGDSALNGLPIQASVQNGVATLSGSVQNDAQRTLAARDAAGVNGVSKVINNLSLAPLPPASATAVTPPPPVPATTPVRPTRELIRPEPPRNDRDRNDARNDHDRNDRGREAAPIERAPQPTAPYQQQQQAQAPPPPPQPTFRNVTVASGSTVPVRITQTLDSATTQPDTTFSGVVASDIVIDGVVAIPAGSAVSGHVDAVQEAGHFKGNSLLTVSLTSISRRGERMAVSTEPYTVTGKGRGANTAEKTGGGAAVGAILGGIFGGGKGAAIGAAAGGGVGAGSNAVTRGQQVQIASESVVRFHLSTPVQVRVRTDANGERPERRDGDGGLQPR